MGGYNDASTGTQIKIVEKAKRILKNPYLISTSAVTLNGSAHTAFGTQTQRIVLHFGGLNSCEGFVEVEERTRN